MAQHPRNLARTVTLLALITASASLTTTSALAAGSRPKAPKPVTVVATSACVNYRWVVTVAVTSSTDRVVDAYDTSDQYTNRRLVAGAALKANVAYTFSVSPGSSAQKEEIGIFAAGSGGWAGSSDPLASKVVFDPIQSNPYATC